MAKKGRFFILLLKTENKILDSLGALEYTTNTRFLYQNDVLYLGTKKGDTLAY